MDELRTLHDLGIEPTSFHISPSPGWGTMVNVYAFMGQAAHLTEGPWDLIKVSRLDKPPLVYELKLIHIEEEELESPDFDGERDSGGYVTLTPVRLDALVRLLRALGGEHLSKEQVDPYFIVLSDEDLVRIGFPPGFVQTSRGDQLRCFRYMQYGAVGDRAETQLVWISGWTSSSPLSATMYLEFATYDAERMSRIRQAFSTNRDQVGDRPLLDLTLLQGTGALRLSQRAFSALSTLLEWHQFPLQRP